MLTYSRGQALRMWIALAAIVVAALASIAIVMGTAPPITSAEVAPDGHNSGACATCHDISPVEGA